MTEKKIDVKVKAKGPVEARSVVERGPDGKARVVGGFGDVGPVPKDEEEPAKLEVVPASEPEPPTKLPKVGEVITIVKLQNLYDKYAVQVLSDRLDRQPREKKGAIARYKVEKELPQPAEYRKLKTAKFKTTVGSLVEDAGSIIEEVAGELRDWYDNLNEGLQQSDTGNRLDEAASTLENADKPDVPDAATNIEAVFLPGLDVNSRMDRVREAAEMLRAAQSAMSDTDDKIDCEACEGAGKATCDKCGTEDATCPECEGEGKVESDEVREFASALETLADEVEQVDIPGMYGK